MLKHSVTNALLPAEQPAESWEEALEPKAEVEAPKARPPQSITTETKDPRAGAQGRLPRLHPVSQLSTLCNQVPSRGSEF